MSPLDLLESILSSCLESWENVIINILCEGKMNQEPGKDFYRAVINESLFPFWDKAVDRGNGGIFTCYHNSTGNLL